MIHTRLHKLVDLVGADADPFCGHHHYVIADDIIEMMSRTDCQSSIQALIDADLARLPFDAVLIEWHPLPTSARFVVLSESDGVIVAHTAALYSGDAATIGEVRATVTVCGGGISVLSSVPENDARAIGLATAMALLLLNTRGIKKDVIEAQRLNRSRIASGKPPIPTHTMLRIGTVYDSRNRAHEFSEASGRRSMRVHLRQGHARMQACGPGRVDREVRYIPPVLVNYSAGDETPAPRVRVVAR